MLLTFTYTVMTTIQHTKYVQIKSHSQYYLIAKAHTYLYPKHIINVTQNNDAHQIHWHPNGVQYQRGQNHPCALSAIECDNYAVNGNGQRKRVIEIGEQHDGAKGAIQTVFQLMQSIEFSQTIAEVVLATTIMTLQTIEQAFAMRFKPGGDNLTAEAHPIDVDGKDGIGQGIAGEENAPS